MGLPPGIKADCCKAVGKERTLTAWNDSSRRHHVKNSTHIFFFFFFHFSNHMMRSDFTDEAGREQTSETCLGSHGKKAAGPGCTPRSETVLVIPCPPTPAPGPTPRPEKLSSRAATTGCFVLWHRAESGRLEAPAEDGREEEKSGCLLTVLTPPLCGRRRPHPPPGRAAPLPDHRGF